jgi:FkbM family methyltransferase
MRLTSLDQGLRLFEINPLETAFLHHEIFVQRTYLRHGIQVRAGATVLDVGANIGMFAIFAQHSAPEVTVHAFEPVPEVCSVLRANMSLHGIQGEAHALALGAVDGETTVRCYPAMTMMSGTHADPARDANVTHHVLSQQMHISKAVVDAVFASRLMDAQVARLSTVLSRLALPHVDLLKIDVERAELEVLDGIDPADWHRIRQVVAEVHDEGDRLPRVRALLAAQHFDVVVEPCAWAAGLPNVTVYAVRD